MAEPTLHAPAERADVKEVGQDYAALASIELLRSLLAVLPYAVVILNNERQAVFANDALLQSVGVKSVNGLLGERPGDFLHCIHRSRHDGGCGTSEQCRYCGTVNAILDSRREGKSVTRECRISSVAEGKPVSLDLEVTASPFSAHGHTYTLLTVQDKSSEVRRRILERVFFHDVINTAGGIVGLAEILAESAQSTETRQLSRDLLHASSDLIQEISAQKELMAAENGELELQYGTAGSLALVDESVGYYRYHDVARGCELEVAADSEDVPMITDSRLVKRVLGNMIKNALEASPRGSTVTVGSRRDGDHVLFHVHNQTHMERNVQMQVFQRSFSTRARDRGLGTYSMKLLTERYLGGTVSFTSSPDDGTVFTTRVPAHPAELREQQG